MKTSCVIHSLLSFTHRTHGTLGKRIVEALLVAESRRTEFQQFKNCLNPDFKQDGLLVSVEDVAAKQAN